MLLGTLYWQLISNKQTKRENTGRLTNQVKIMIYSTNVYCQIALNRYHSWLVGHVCIVVPIWQSLLCKACLKHPVELLEIESLSMSRQHYFGISMTRV